MNGTLLQFFQHHRVYLYNIRVAKKHKRDPEPHCCCKANNTIVGMNKASEIPTCGQLVFNPEKVITALRQDAHYGSLVSYLR